MKPRSPVTDEELVKRIQRNDSRSWSEFLERHTDVIYRMAQQYSRASSALTTPSDNEDEVAELYLFMAESVLRSLRSFRGGCKPSTWVISVIGNRKHLLKAFLLKKDPGGADIRLPAVMESRSETDKEVFRKLVWGLEVGRIAQELDLPEVRCREVEDLLARNSPRVYARIQANRCARAPKFSLDEWTEDDRGRPRLQVAHPGPGPEEQATLEWLRVPLLEGLTAALDELSSLERRVLSLLYDEGMSAIQVVELAASDPEMGLKDVGNVNHCYYLKDRALERILTQITEKLKRAGHLPPLVGDRRKLYKALEDLLREQGVPMQRSR